MTRHAANHSSLRRRTLPQAQRGAHPPVAVGVLRDVPHREGSLLRDGFGDFPSARERLLIPILKPNAMNREDKREAASQRALPSRGDATRS